MMKFRTFPMALAVCVAICLTGEAPAALTITVDYTLDTGGFFTANPTGKTLLESAASALSSRISDTLTAIDDGPDGGNTWTRIFPHPGTGVDHSIVDLDVATGVIIVYAGGRELGGSTLGVGGPGGYGYSGTAAWADTVSKRGQAGATDVAASSTDFGPWGGAISFDSAGTSWYFDTDPTTTEAFAGMSDFYSVALHELGHLVGFGTAPSWDHFVSGSSTFFGPVSKSLNGGVDVPLDAGLGHWVDGKTSTLPGTATIQEANMDPSLTTGTRKYFTDLDFGGLDDVGWDVTAVPEPHQYAMIVGFGLIGFAAFRRRLLRGNAR